MRWFKRHTIQSGPFKGTEYASWKEATFWLAIGVCAFTFVLFKAFG